MATILSSRRTPYFKFVVPVLVVAGIGAGASQKILHPGRTPVPTAGWPGPAWLPVAAIMLVALVVMRFTVGRLKYVELHDDELLVSNYVTEIRVPLSAIAALGGPSRSNPRRYWVTLDEPSEFGRRITFMPPQRWGRMFWSEPEVIGELRQAWEAARATDGRERHA